MDCLTQPVAFPREPLCRFRFAAALLRDRGYALAEAGLGDFCRVSNGRRILVARRAYARYI